MPKDYPYYWNMGQPKAIRFSYEDSLGGYLYMYKKILEILEVVLESPKVIEPYEGLKHLYVLLLEYFYSVQKREDFKHIPPIDFKKFASLILVNQEFAIEWKKQKHKYIDYLRLIDGEFKATSYSFDHVRIPHNLHLMMSPINDNLKHHLDLVKEAIDNTNHNYQSYADKLFTAHKSTRRSIFLILEDSKNEWVQNRMILKKLNITYNDFRSIITQIRKIVVEKGLSNLIHIMSDRKGAYKLTISAS